MKTDHQPDRRRDERRAFPGPLARDLMQDMLVTVYEDEDIWSVARTLTQFGISGAPVLNAAKDLVGVVSQTDLVRYLKDEARDVDDFYSDPEGTSRLARRPPKAKDLMTKEIIGAPETATAAELRKLMLSRKIHRILITSGRRLVGIVTTMDLLRVP